MPKTFAQEKVVETDFFQHQTSGKTSERHLLSCLFKTISFRTLKCTGLKEAAELERKKFSTEKHVFTSQTIESD